MIFLRALKLENFADSHVEPLCKSPQRIIEPATIVRCFKSIGSPFDGFILIL